MFTISRSLNRRLILKSQKAYEEARLSHQSTTPACKIQATFRFARSRPANWVPIVQSTLWAPTWQPVMKSLILCRFRLGLKGCTLRSPERVFSISVPQTSCSWRQFCALWAM